MKTKIAGEHTQGEKTENLYSRILISCADLIRRDIITNGDYVISTNGMILCKMPLKLIDIKHSVDEILYSKYDSVLVNAKNKNTYKEKIIQVDEVNEILKKCPKTEIDINKTNHIECNECKGMGRVFYEYVTKNTPSSKYKEEYDCPVCDGDGHFVEKETSSKTTIDKDAIIHIGISYFKMDVFFKVLNASRLLEKPVEINCPTENSFTPSLVKVGEIEFLAMPFNYIQGVSRSTFYEVEI